MTVFQVAKYWYELYIRHTPGGEQLLENEMPHEPMLDPHGALVALIDAGPDVQMAQGLPAQNGPPVLANGPPVVVTTAPPPPFQHPTATTLAPLGMPVPYAVAPYSFAVQGLHHVSYGGPIHPHAVHLHQPPHPHMQMYVQSPQFQYPPHTNNQQFSNNQQPSYGGMPNGQPPTFAVSSSGPSQYQLPGPGPSNYSPGQGMYSYLFLFLFIVTRSQGNIHYIKLHFYCVLQICIDICTQPGYKSSYYSILIL